MERISSYGSLPLMFTYLTCFQILVYQASLSLASSCLDSERQALTKFREGLNDPLGCLSSWDVPNCCKWRGITCDNKTGYVVKLNLGNPYTSYAQFDDFIVGPLPIYDFWNLSGQLDPALSRLKHLRHLDLSGNSFGIPFPEFLTSFKELRYLNLSFGKYSGRIPDRLGNLSNIEYLDISDNSLHARNLHWLANMSSLKYLNLNHVNLSEVTENWVHVIDEIPSLVELRMVACGLSDIAQTLSYNNLTSLRVLDLAMNNFNSSIPNWIGNMTSLTSLSLSDCSFQGRVPYSLSELLDLKYLDLSNNVDLSADCSKLLGRGWSSIQTIDMKFNEVYGEIPSFIGNITTLVYLDLSFNCLLTGSLPNGIGHLQNLKYLSLSNCKLKSSIPASVGRLSSLEFLSVNGNRLIGSIPSTLGQLSKLVTLDLSQNELDGQIPSSLSDCGSLEMLDLNSNILLGSIPSSLGLLSSIRILQLSNNHLSGELPLSLRNCSNLQGIEMGENKLSGNIPAWIGESFPALGILSLRSNMFKGEIPPQLSNLTSLQVIDLSHNLLFGPIPQSFGNFAAMRSKQNTSMDLGYGMILFRGPLFRCRPITYEGSLVVDMKGIQLEYSSILSLVTYVDLSHNSLSSEIPKNLTLLLGLRGLNLSGNNLSGEIPSEIGRLVSMESLDLSRNQLSGEIPHGMSSLTFLRCWNLSNNNLTGRIPSGLLQILNDPSMYSGNPQLCGHPLQKRCEEYETPQSPGEEDKSEDGDWIEIQWFSIGMAPGFFFGFWAILGILIFKQSWRISLSYFIDEVKESFLCVW